MKEFLKKNLIVIVAFLVPMLLVLGMTLSVYLPSFLLSTDYNFVYSICSDGMDFAPYQCNKFLFDRFSILNHRLYSQPINATADADRDGIPDVREEYVVHLFLHDTKENVSREITFEEAQQLRFSDALTSPDGVMVFRLRDTYLDVPFLIDTNSSDHYYLTKGNRKKKLYLIERYQEYSIGGNFHFVGWVVPDTE